MPCLSEIRHLCLVYFAMAASSSLPFPENVTIHSLLRLIVHCEYAPCSLHRGILHQPIVNGAAKNVHVQFPPAGRFPGVG